MASLLLGLWLRNMSLWQSRKSDFGWHDKTVVEVSAVLALLDSFQCMWNGKPESLLYLMFVIFFNLMKSSVVYAAIWFMHVCKI